MNWIPNIFLRHKLYDDLSEEIRLHIEERAEQLMNEGMSRHEAEQAARRAFGNRTLLEERSREVWQWPTLESIWADLRFAVRQLRKAPGFTFAAILTLALAIGANAVVFGIMDALILRPLHVPQPETLYGTEYGDYSGFQSYPNYLDLRDRNHSFEDLAAFNFVFAGLDTGNDPTAATGYSATGNYFDVLKVQPYLGRFFHAADEHGRNSAPYIVLSYAYWHSRFQDDRGVVGRVVQLDKHPFTVIGVSPPEFRGTLVFASPDFFIPVVNEEQVSGDGILGSRENTHGLFEAFGHLKPGVTPAQAIADVNAVGADLEKTYPSQVSHKPSSLAREGLTSFGRATAAFVGGLMVLAGLILLAACTNLGSLFAAHAADRSREVALRLALGSSRTRILRQLLTEAVLISLAGGALGVLGSVALLRKLSDWTPFPSAPIHLPLNPDARIYGVALVLALISGFLFGIVPVRQVLRANPYEIVKTGANSRLGRRMTLRDALLVVQIAICAVLVTSSMVAVRGLLRSMTVNVGFEPRKAMLLNLNLAMAGYSSDKAPGLERRMIDAVETIPGVEHVGMVNDYPPLVYAAGVRADVFKDETRETKQSNVFATPYRYNVSPGYFDAAGTSLLAGRDFAWRDDKNAPAVAVANKEFAARMFGSVSNAVGRFFRMQDGSRVQVVGVVEDGKYMSLTESQQPAIFLPALRSPNPQASLVVRSNRDPEQLAAAMRRKVSELDAGLPVDIQTWHNMLDVVFFPSRVATMALGILGLMGAMLSITGIFGMAAYSVSKRLRELGIRIALGAQRKEVLQAVKLLALGSVAGLLLGILASRVLAFIVYQATPRDPLVLSGVVLAMALLGLLATWIPAQRALSVNPLLLLREE